MRLHNFNWLLKDRNNQLMSKFHRLQKQSYYISAMDEINYPVNKQPIEIDIKENEYQITIAQFMKDLTSTRR